MGEENVRCVRSGEGKEIMIKSAGEVLGRYDKSKAEGELLEIEWSMPKEGSLNVETTSFQSRYRQVRGSTLNSLS